PLLLQVAPHFFLGFGPYAYHDFALAGDAQRAGSERTTLEARLVVGGFWGGTETEKVETETKAQRFGDADTIAITNESAVAFHWTPRAGAGLKQESIVISPGIDWFLSECVSLGLALSYNKFEVAGWEPDGLPVTTTGEAFGASVRAGYDFRVARWL